MKKRCLKNGGRQKAFWGAVIPAVASLIGTGLSIASQKSAQEEAEEAQRQANLQNLMRQQKEQSAATINNYFAATGQEPEREFVYKNGGKRKLCYAGAILTDGGPLLSSTGEFIYPGQTVPPGMYRDLGPSHKQTNAQGKKGTGAVTLSGDKFETQGKETWVVDPKEIDIFSNNLGKDGISYADQVWNGKNPKIAAKEQAIDRRRHLRHGKSTPVDRNRAAWGATFTTPDYIGLGANIGASLLSGLWANKAYNDLKDNVDYSLPSYVDESYVSGPTNWDNTAKKAEVRRAQLMGRRSIANNTASSAVGLGRMQNLDTNSMYELNKLWDEKANKEVELRQANAERQQGVRARNAAARNAYYQKVADIQNQQLATNLGIDQAKVNSNVGMIQGIGSSIGGFLQQGIDNYQNNQAMLAQIAASPYGTAERLHSLGYKFDTDIREALKNDAASRLNQYKTDFSDAGTKAYNDAFNSYNLWSKSLGNKDRAKMRINLRTAATTPIFRQDTSFLTRKPIIRV